MTNEDLEILRMQIDLLGFARLELKLKSTIWDEIAVLETKESIKQLIENHGWSKLYAEYKNKKASLEVK